MTDRKIFSNYIAECNNDRTHSTYARVIVKNAGGDVVVDPIGYPVISDNAGAFKLYANTDDIAAVTSSTLPDGSPVGIIVGGARGAGINQTDETITAAGTSMTVLFRDATAVFDSINYGLTDVDGVIATGATEADAGEKAAFALQLEKQRVKNLELAPAADPKFV